MIRENLKFIKGDTYSRGIIIEGLKTPIEQIYFTVKNKSSDKHYLIQKRLIHGIEQDPDNPNRYVVIIEADDTNDMKVNYNYVYDIEIITLTMKRTIIAGNLRLEDWDITSKANEV
jgi:hypothetical protein